MSPGTKFAREFYAGIGPLQLGVVLVSIVLVWVKYTKMIGHMHAMVISIITSPLSLVS